MRRTTIRVPAKPYIPVPWHIRVFKTLCYISAAIMLYAMILIVVFSSWSVAERKPITQTAHMKPTRACSSPTRQ